MKKVVGLMIGLVPVSAFAECSPTIDCARLGYTETSCDGDSLKCPFDLSKLLCIPCDTSFKYSSSGENITGGVGDTCTGKYSACACIDGTVFTNGECIRDPRCDVVGNIMYSDGSCSENKLDNKTPVGIIAYKDDSKHLLLSIEPLSMSWSSTQTDAEGNTIIAQYTDLSGLYNYSNKDLALTDYNGFDNTRVIVEAYGENATEVAAVYCYNYAPTGLESSKRQWYLPATGELHDIVFKNKVKINKGFTALGMNFLNSGNHWSSSEFNNGIAWFVVSGNGNVNNYYAKTNSLAVSCLLAI